MDDFPQLSLAVLEVGCDWMPQVVKGMRERRSSKIDEWLGDRVFVACAVGDDLSYVVDRLGDDFLITASDFPHGDAFREDRLAEQLQQRGDLTAGTIDKILAGNPARAFDLGA
jgi:hypothetical protein